MNDEKRIQTDAEHESRQGVRKVPSAVSLGELKEDLERFRRTALQSGAAMAEVIPANWVKVDERVRLKCSVPLCGYYGRSAHCPPRGPDIPFIREALGRYGWAVLFAVDVIPAEEFADGARGKTRGAWFRKNMEIAATIETLAFKSGYYLAAAFTQGSCKAALCGGTEGCRVLEGKGCANPLKSRPSMESAGIDVFGLVTKVGWDVYPICRSVDPAAVPRALSVGIVFVY